MKSIEFEEVTIEFVKISGKKHPLESLPSKIAGLFRICQSAVLKMTRARLKQIPMNASVRNIENETCSKIVSRNEMSRKSWNEGFKK